MKRFYKTAASEASADGFALLLDGRPAKTPLRAPLAAPTSALADALAVEWDAQTDQVDPLAMPLTRIACAAIDHTTPNRAETVAGLVAYGETDLLCYRAENPRPLVARQSEAWDPIIAWAADAYDAPLRLSAGVVPAQQPAQALTALRGALDVRGPWTLAGLSAAVDALGSLLLGLALADGRLDADAAFAASRVDEDWQREQWGADEEADARAAHLRADLDAAARFMALVENGGHP
ncbi:MAG: ATP12 family protein [Pseudomonadota bacterium]